MPNSPKLIFRLTFENNPFAASVEQWLRYADSRIDTLHNHSGEKAQVCLESMGDFMDDTIGLYQNYDQGKTWE